MLIGEIQIKVFRVLGDADVHRALWAIELRPCFQQVERRADGRCARRLPGRLVLAAPQPAAEPLAAYGPGH